MTPNVMYFISTCIRQANLLVSLLDTKKTDGGLGVFVCPFCFVLFFKTRAICRTKHP